MPKEITIPYQYQPRPYQLELLAAPQRYKIAVFNRRAGKSKTALNDQVRKAQLKKGIYYYFLPTYRQAKSVIWDSLVKEHIPPEIVEKKNDSELAIYYKNGSIQRFVGCEDIDKHRGINPIDVVFDEYSEMNEEIWTAVIRPVLAENNGTATFIFTPKGKGHSWKLLQMAKDNPKDWFWTVKTVFDTKSHSEAEIEAVKKETPQALFEQEYLCSFQENAGAFFRRVRNNLWKATDEPEEGHKYKLGVDLAKYQDWTVITKLDLSEMKVLRQDRFNQIDWNLQKSMIEAKSRRFFNARADIDSTGVGDPIVEDLQRTGLQINAYKFTETSRRQLLDNLAIMLEQDKIKLPEDEGLLSELEAFRFELSEQGKIKVRVPENMTDDRVMSLALACWEAKQETNTDVRVKEWMPQSEYEGEVIDNQRPQIRII